jgi:hypothetical protein
MCITLVAQLSIVLELLKPISASAKSLASNVNKAFPLRGSQAQPGFEVNHLFVEIRHVPENGQTLRVGFAVFEQLSDFLQLSSVFLKIVIRGQFGLWGSVRIT